MQLPLFEPESSWREPDSLPDVPSGVVLAVDTEGDDPGLAADRAPSWMTGRGYMAGVSVAWGDQSHYIPMRHPDSKNQDPEQTLRWLEDAMSRSSSVVMHNSTYDVGCLQRDGAATPTDRLDDTQYMAVMIDENQLQYGLDAVCRRSGVPGKNEQKLREAAAAYSCDPKRDMAKMPARYVGEYAAQDAAATLALREKLAGKLDEEGLNKAYRLEMDLVPMFVEMQRRGVRVDEAQADRVQKRFRERRDQSLEDMRSRLGWRRKLSMDEINSPRYLMIMFDEQGVSYPRTPKTKMGSFKSDWMAESNHWLPQAVAATRKVNDLAEKFVGTYILDAVHLGRVHPQIHQLRDDDGGTRTYRLSYSDPPLHQAPARTDDGRMIRTILVPERGDLWLSDDYSQQEPRMAVHFAALHKVHGWEDAVRYYTRDPDADFHQMVADLTGLSRKQAKIINLALMYGMGLPKLAARLGETLERAREIMDQYNEKMPFIRALAEKCAAAAAATGHIHLIDGARCRFPLWEKAWRDGGAGASLALPYEKALIAWSGQALKRSKTHKAFNSKVQGSSARQTKMAMRDCYREGYTPLIQMHDELGHSVSSPADGARIRQIMIDATPLKVPMKVDAQYGWSWGQASQEFKKIEPPSFEELMRHGPTVSSEEIIARRAA